MKPRRRDERLDLRLRRRRQRMKGRRTRVRVDDKNAVREQRVTMQIEVACGAKTLQGYDCPRLGLVEASEAQLSFGSGAFFSGSRRR
jgi:hypothetical protein